MENIFEIKEEYKAAVVGFNNSGLPLGKRSDLHLLALLAHKVPDRAKYFVRLPSEEEIRNWQAEKSLTPTLSMNGEGENKKSKRSRKQAISDAETGTTEEDQQ